MADICHSSIFNNRICSPEERRNMNYQQFVATLNERINQRLNPETTSQIHSALKNNGAKRTGLTISQKGTNISPTIYLEEYYSQYQNGWTLDEITENIIQLYKEVRFKKSWEVRQVQDFKLAQSKVAYKLIHFAQNETLLKELPHIPYLDLAIVFFLLLETTEKGAATILITNDMLDYWNISLETLYQIALKNTPDILHADFKPMRVVIQELLEKPLSKVDLDDNCLYVLSNHHRHFGAACMLYERVLEDIGNQLNEDFYILPSSIHEVIILPASSCLNHDELSEMVVEINETQVSEEDVLSDHAYYYSRKENRILVD